MENQSRRRFIKQTFIGAAGIASLPLLQSFKVGANDTIRFGIIGLGQQAMNLMMGFYYSQTSSENKIGTDVDAQ